MQIKYPFQFKGESDAESYERWKWYRRAGARQKRKKDAFVSWLKKYHPPKEDKKA